MKLKTGVRSFFATTTFVLFFTAMFMALNGPVVAQTTRLSIGGASPGGTGYILASGIAKIIDEHIPNTYSTVEATAGSIENIRLIEAGKIQMGMIMTDMAKYAYDGKKPFEKPHKNVRLALIGETSALAFVVRADSDIKSISDLKNRRVGVGAPGSASAAIMVPAVLEAYGLSYEDIKEHLIGQRETGSALADRQIDCGVFYAGTPAAAISELAITHAIRLLPVSDEAAKKILGKYPYFALEKIPKGTYKGFNEDALAVGNSSSLTVSADLPETLVYNIVKALDQHMEAWKKIHPGARFYTPDRAVGFGERAIPFHPGAIRYFKEKGLLK